MTRRAAVSIWALLVTAPVFAQSGGGYEVPMSTVAGGGGSCTCDGFVLNGTIGQPDAGNMSGGGFTLSGGFWVPGLAAAPAGAPLPAGYPDNRQRNRYIAFDPNKTENDGSNVAFKITLTALSLGSCDNTGSPDVEGWACRDDDDCRACRDVQNPCWTAPINCVPNTQTCDLTGAQCVNDQAGSVGQSWWVGPASPNGVHLLVDEPNRTETTDWPDPVIVGDCEIVPAAGYEVTVVLVGSETEGPDPLAVQTINRPDGGNKYWADCVGTLGEYCTGDWAPCPNGVSDCQAGESCFEQWPPPDGFISFVDVQAAVFTFAQLPGLTVTEPLNLDLHGANTGQAEIDPPNFLVTFDDIGWMIKAFQGYPYPYNDPNDCPPVTTW